MSRSERYEACLEIFVEHGYYASAVPIKFEPDEKTGMFFRRTGWIFRRLSDQKYIVAHPEGKKADNARLAFTISPADPLFYQVTEGGQAEGGEVEVVGRNGVWGVLSVETVGTVHLRFRPKEKKMEFVLIPRHTDPQAKIILREERGRVEFLPPERVEILGREAFSVVSKDKIPLAERTEFRFKLWEQRDSGERLLAANIPPPRPGEASITDPEESITTYFYY